MRTIGLILMIVGALAMAAAVLALLGPHLRIHGVITGVAVTSVRGTFIGGAACLVGGALLRRRARVSDPPVA